jgi:tRNA pseudouridine55 synthase
VTHVSERRARDADIHGVFVVDKPEGPTSFDLVARGRRAFGTRAIGHAGTLDPLATGVLVLLVGNATKLQRVLLDHDKRYTATISFGARTTTDDRAGDVVERADLARLAALTDVDVRTALARFVGRIEQVPPAHSAIHIDGERAYEKARRGEEVEMKARAVTIRSIDVIEPLAIVRDDSGAIVDARVVIDVLCEKGTYIRSIARDVGAAVGVPAHLHALRRTASGGFTLADAAPAAMLEADREAAKARLRTGRAAVAGAPILDVTEAEREHLRHGRAPRWDTPFEGLAIAACGDELVAIVSHASGAVRLERGR